MEQDQGSAVPLKNTVPAIVIAMIVAAGWMLLTPGLEPSGLQGLPADVSAEYEQGQLEGQLIGEALTASLVLWAIVYFFWLRRSGRKRGVIAFIAIAGVALLANAAANFPAFL